MKLVLLGVCLLLAACESTSFQAAPVVERPCDPVLTGHWRPVDDQPGQADDAVLSIDARCQLQFADIENGARRVGQPTQAHFGSDGDNHYLWVDAAWAVARFDLKQSPPAGDLFLVRYRVEEGQLVLQLTDDRAIAHRIIDGKFNGEVRRIDGDLRNRILAPVDPAIMREAGFFAVNETRLRRQPEAKAP